VTVSLADGVASRGDAQGDVITNVERVIGSAFGDDLRGSAGSDTLEGGAGDDQLDGGAGDDLLIGGTGNDVFVFSAGFGSDRIADLDIGG
jgi:Ca2+-binding RTX toxin-like protein